MKTLIFGAGYTGSRLCRLIPNAQSTELPELCSENQIPFDFNDTSTWNALPDFDQAVITFKMTRPDLAEKFSEIFKNKTTVLLSSARNFANSQPDEVINEKHPFKELPRVSAESFFQEQALILYLGLIWGPDREPKKWLSEGRIKNGNKCINFINVDDLCNIIIHFLKNQNKCGKYLISDGKPRQWKEIAESAGIKLNISQSGLESRRFNTEKLRGSLPDDFEFTLPESY